MEFIIVKIKAWSAGNSKPITLIQDADIGYFETRLIVHDLIRGSLITTLLRGESR